MRIAVISPPKSGNIWLKCLLSTIYGLDWLVREDKESTNPKKFQAWVDRGGFRDGTILHQHCRYTDALCDVLEATPAHVVTIVRDPYDVFASLFHYVNTRYQAGTLQEQSRPRDTLADKPIDHPDALAFLADDFGTNLMRAEGWVGSGRAHVVRYEGLHADPVAELRQVTDAIAPVDDTRIAAAVEHCTAENMRARSERLARHVRAATVGDSKQHLTEAHLAIFREKHADAIRRLGYEVR